MTLLVGLLLGVAGPVEKFVSVVLQLKHNHHTSAEDPQASSAVVDTSRQPQLPPNSCSQTTQTKLLNMSLSSSTIRSKILSILSLTVRNNYLNYCQAETAPIFQYSAATADQDVLSEMAEAINQAKDTL